MPPRRASIHKEIVADPQFVTRPDASVDLDGLLANEPRSLTDHDLQGGRRLFGEGDSFGLMKPLVTHTPYPFQQAEAPTAPLEPDRDLRVPVPFRARGVSESGRRTL